MSFDTLSLVVPFALGTVAAGTIVIADHALRKMRKKICRK